MAGGTRSRWHAGREAPRPDGVVAPRGAAGRGRAASLGAGETERPGWAGSSGGRESCGTSGQSSPSQNLVSRSVQWTGWPLSHLDPLQTSVVNPDSSAPQPEARGQPLTQWFPELASGPKPWAAGTDRRLQTMPAGDLGRPASWAPCGSPWARARMGWFPVWPQQCGLTPVPSPRHWQRLCVPCHHPHHCAHGPPPHGGVSPAAGREGAGRVPGAPRGPLGDRAQPGRVPERLRREPRGGRRLPGHPVPLGGRGPRLGRPEGRRCIRVLGVGWGPALGPLKPRGARNRQATQWLGPLVAQGRDESGWPGSQGSHLVSR